MNRTVLEYFVLALLIGLGTPIFAVWGALDGEKLALVAYPKVQEESKPHDATIDKTVFISSPEAIGHGDGLYKKNCVACHGENADGQGPAAKALIPAPRNFLDAKAKYTRTREPLDLFTVISNGSPGTGMVGFASLISPAERWALVHYLGSLPGLRGQFRETTADQIELLEKSADH